MTDQAPETIAAELEKEVKEKYPIIIQTGKVSEPVAGYVIHGEKGISGTTRSLNITLFRTAKAARLLLSSGIFSKQAKGMGHGLIICCNSSALLMK
ncbi:hypothetical protein [Geobacillus jurassicus]|uniref:Uncharacterized protein n=1 Tax=Geobacillus jurassicus TaxID=235932 RepID=A0ABV6GWH6_9BACL|nr:hypothetical protein [Geobacillus jurassicus]